MHSMVQTTPHTCCNKCMLQSSLRYPSIVMSMLCPLLPAVEKVLGASNHLGFSCQASGPASHQHSQEKQDTGSRGHREPPVTAAPTASSAPVCGTSQGHHGRPARGTIGPEMTPLLTLSSPALTLSLHNASRALTAVLEEPVKFALLFLHYYTTRGKGKEQTAVTSLEMVVNLAIFYVHIVDITLNKINIVSACLIHIFNNANLHFI